LDTYDFDFQHRISLLQGHNIVWGLGFRYSNDNVQNTPFLAFLPPYFATRLYSGFLHDEITVFPNRFRVTVGSKFEHNSFSGVEFQPSIRFTLLLNQSHMLWWAVTRAVRTPSRIDRDLFIPATPPYLLAGGTDFGSEELVAFELGYRWHSGSLFSLEASSFYNTYDDLRSLEPGPPFVLKNGLEGSTYGIELELNVAAADWWHWRAGYAYLQEDLRPKPGSQDINNGQGEGNDPKHRLNLQSMIDLPENIELSLWFRAVSELPSTTAQVPGYVTLDAQLGWQVRHGFTVSVAGKNLLQEQHAEFGAPSSRKEIQRGAYAKIQWTY
jgi:iron complex outermembrane receptor protein